MSDKSSLESVSESYRSRGSFVEPAEDGVDTEVVQKQNHSEHAGGDRGEPVTPPESTIPNTVNEGAETTAATTPAGEHQPDSGSEDPTVISGDAPQADGPSW